MALEGFGSELSLTAIILLGLRVIRDIIKERREKKRAIQVVNGDHESHNPGKNSTSTDLVLHLLEEHGEKLTKLEEGQRKSDVRLAVIETRLNMKES